MKLLDHIKQSACAHLNPHLEEISVKRNKHGNVKVEYDGMLFDSTWERDVWIDLKLLEKIGEIKNLRRQVEYVLIDKQEGERKMSIIVDFEYVVVNTGKLVVADAKSEHTRKLQTYINKRKLFRKKYGFAIKEIVYKKRKR